MKEVRNENVIWISDFPVDDRSAYVDALFLVEGLESDRDRAAIMNFAELIEWFNGWDQMEEDEDSRYDNIWDYLEDALGNGIHPVRIMG